MTDRLGPLGVADGEWVIGDPTQGNAKYLKLGRRGIGRWSNGCEVELIPWSRIMELGLEVRPGKAANSKSLTRLTNVVLSLTGIARFGGGPARLTASLRSPYEDWDGEFTCHVQGYSSSEISLASELIRQIIDTKNAEKFSDPRWVSGSLGEAAKISLGRFESPESAVRRIINSSY